MLVRKTRHRRQRKPPPSPLATPPPLDGGGSNRREMMMPRKGNAGNLRPRTKEGLQAALDASLTAGAGVSMREVPGAIRKAMMQHGYVARVVFEDPDMVATSGALVARSRFLTG